MAEIIKVYSEQAPKSRFVGIRYTEKDRAGGSFAHIWGSWFEHKRFEVLEGLAGEAWVKQYPEAMSYVGLMRMKEEQEFEYWVGMFLSPDTRVPAGYDHLDLPAMNLGVCWVKGQEPDIYHQDEAVFARLKEAGYETLPDEDGYTLLMERYQCPRFTQKDEDGLVTLDVVAKIAYAQGEEPSTDTETASTEGKFYCANCRKANDTEKCDECGDKGAPLQMDDPIYIGELPGRLRNAFQIAFSATEIPFNALANLGSGFTLSAGDLFESYRIYVPYERAQEAREAFDKVFEINE